MVKINEKIHWTLYLRNNSKYAVWCPTMLSRRRSCSPFVQQILIYCNKYWLAQLFWLHQCRETVTKWLCYTHIMAYYHPMEFCLGRGQNFSSLEGLSAAGKIDLWPLLCPTQFDAQVLTPASVPEPRPPRASEAKGMKASPCFLHASSPLVTFLLSSCCVQSLKHYQEWSLPPSLWPSEVN